MITDDLIQNLFLAHLLILFWGMSRYTGLPFKSTLDRIYTVLQRFPKLDNSCRYCEKNEEQP
jgi:hypothetical protein